MRLNEARRDLYRRLAHEQGYKSRAAFKLIQANSKYGIIRAGDRVVDLGAAPGGWVQVCSDVVGDSGLVIGVDERPMTLHEPNVKTIKANVYDASIEETLLELLRGQADVVLSDLAPDVSGVWELDHNKQVELTLRVLSLSGRILKKRGNAFIKIFEGERSRELRDLLKRGFELARVMKPDASRRQSAEMYYACIGWRGLEDAAFTASTTSS